MFNFLSCKIQQEIHSIPITYRKHKDSLICGFLFGDPHFTNTHLVLLLSARSSQMESDKNPHYSLNIWYFLCFHVFVILWPCNSTILPSKRSLKVIFSMNSSFSPGKIICCFVCVPMSFYTYFGLNRCNIISLHVFFSLDWSSSRKHIYFCFSSACAVLCIGVNE